jgi:protein-tyrosine phosphatase
MLKPLIHYINDNYGSKRGLLNGVKGQLWHGMGNYRSLRMIDWELVDRLIFICHGNICRSPLAEVCAQSLGAKAESFGLLCRDGRTADPRAIRYAANVNLDFSKHRTRNIAGLKAGVTDLLVVMEPGHLQGLSNAVSGAAQVTLAGLWLPNPQPYIHDPYSANDKYFSRCEGAVMTATEVLAKNMVLRTE